MPDENNLNSQSSDPNSAKDDPDQSLNQAWQSVAEFMKELKSENDR